MTNDGHADDRYNPDKLAKLTGKEVGILVKKLGTMQPTVAMDNIREALSSPKTLPRETLVAFACAPFVFPHTVFGIFRKRDGRSDMVDGIPDFISQSMHDLGYYANRKHTSFHAKYCGRYSLSMKRPCHKRESLAAFAVFGRHGDDALALLERLEKARPGFVSSVRDGVGNNLLWYLALRDRIWIYGDARSSCVVRHPGDDRRVRDFLLDVGCDPTARNAFGICWDEARETLASFPFPRLV
jgi:hypothetical protein